MVVAAGALLVAADGAGIALRRSGGVPGRVALAGAEEAVARFIADVRAVHDSGGDPRVADRLRTTPDIVSEILSGMAFAERRLGAEERDELVRMDWTGARWLPSGAAEVRTREYWIFRTRPRAAGPAETSVVSAIWNVRYELIREGSSWRVVDYRLASTRDGATDPAR